MTAVNAEGSPVPFAIAAAICFVAVAVGLRFGFVFGLSFRDRRFIAQRHETPFFYWTALLVWGAIGAFAALIAVALPWS
jgi:hypothetical protein